MTAALIANKIFTRMRSEVICIAPPLTTDEATLDELVDGVRNAIVSVFGE
jgi:adenosylmethionine-8-amino-7-oxononanoate aminotransferase